MANGVLIAILMLVIIASVVISAVAHHHHKKQEARRQLTRKVRRQAHDIARLCHSLKAVGVDAELSAILAEHWKALVAEGLKVDPGNEELIRARDEADSVSQELCRVIPQTAVNEAQIKTWQGAIAATILTLRKLRDQNVITSTTFSQWETYLRRKYLDIEVEGLVTIAAMLRDSGQRSKAASYYRSAQNRLIQSRVHGPEKKERIRDIGAMAKQIWSVNREPSPPPSSAGEA